MYLGKGVAMMAAKQSTNTKRSTPIQEIIVHNFGVQFSINIGQVVTMCGWVQKSRDLGGMTFVDLRDRYGITQLVFNMDTNSELCKIARELGREYVIQIKGKVIQRASINEDMKTGYVEVEVGEIIILNNLIAEKLLAIEYCFIGGVHGFC